MSSEDPKDNPASGWAVLRSGGGTAGDFEISTVRCETTSRDGPIRLALGQNSEARLLLPLAERSGGVRIVGAPALRIEVASYSSSMGSTRFLDLMCLHRNLESVFAEVAAQILARVQGGESCGDAARSTIEDFRALLLRPPASDVAANKIAGLVGELLYLNRLLDVDPGGWRAWRGPAGDRHDFRNSDLSIEVKCSLRRGATLITINGLHQLEAPSGGALYLQHFELENVPGGMLKVSSLGNAALAKADDPMRLRELLAAVGCPDVNAEAWNMSSFRSEGERLFRINDEFPRLVPSSFLHGHAPAGISDVSYSLDLSLAGPFVVSTEQAAALEARLANCQ